MNSSRRVGLALGLVIGVAWCVGPSPALAKASDKSILRARDACKVIAGNRNWKSIHTSVKTSNADRVVVNVMGKRRGENRTRECRYNIKKRDATFDDQ